MDDLHDSLDFGIVLIGADRHIRVCNRWMRQHARLAGCAVGKTLEQAFAEVPQRVHEAMEQALTRGHSSRLSSALHPCPLPLFSTPQSASRMRHAVDIVAVTGAEGERNCLLQVRDMTESLRREELLRDQARQLQQSKQRLAATLDNAPIGMALSTLDGTWTYVNRALCELLGHDTDSLYQRGGLDHVHPQDRARHRVFENGLIQHHITDFQLEERWLHRSGAPLWVRVTATRVNSDDEPAHLILQIKSIDDAKRKEQQLANALAEKDTLLREVYHRVKNNLQVIQSLLSLKRNSLCDATARTALGETADRVRAMALVHEKLYQSNQLSAIDLGEYLHDLVGQLKEALVTDNDRIQVDLKAASVPADLTTAIPFGLVVTELVTNSLKHAFPDHRQGRLHVSLEPHGEGARLVVSDDGIGLPDGSASSLQGSLGLRLVQSLTRQLDGDLVVTPDPGVRFELTLSRVNHGAQALH